MTVRLKRLQATQRIVNPDGTPTIPFITDWQRNADRIEANDEANDALDALQTAALDALNETTIKANLAYSMVGPGAYAFAASATLPEDCRTALVDTTGGVVTLTLRPVAECLSDVVVKKISGGANNVVVGGAETIDGGATISFNTQYATRTLRPALGAWHLVASYL